MNRSSKTRQQLILLYPLLIFILHDLLGVDEGGDTT
jgi:hypothetical protein